MRSAGLLEILWELRGLISGQFCWGDQKVSIQSFSLITEKQWKWLETVPDCCTAGMGNSRPGGPLIEMNIVNRLVPTCMTTWWRFIHLNHLMQNMQDLQDSGPRGLTYRNLCFSETTAYVFPSWHCVIIHFNVSDEQTAKMSAVIDLEAVWVY